MSRCWCQNYRALEQKNVFGHMRGKRAETGNCMYATDKDLDMREQVRGSFMRVSEGLLGMDVLPSPTSSFETVAEACGGSVVVDPSISCEHTDVPAQLIEERDLLLRTVDELLEQDIPCVDVRWYRKHVEGIRRGKPVHDFR